jgi:hypothetical protein
LPLDRTSSFRYPACHAEDPTLARLAFCTDFEISEQGLAPAVRWSLWESNWDMEWLAEVKYASQTEDGHIRHPAWFGADEIAGGQERWLYESQSGGRVDLIVDAYEPNDSGFWVQEPQPLVVDGAANRQPAFLPAGPNAGLLAYQNDSDDGAHIYLAVLVRDGLGVGGFIRVNNLVRLTSGSGWHGSPAWVPGWVIP